MKLGLTELHQLAEAVIATERPIYFETTPLFEESWTGIPVVTAGLASALCSALPGRTRFFYKNYPVSHEVIADALGKRTGRELQKVFLEARVLPELTAAERSRGVAIFPSVKPLRNMFGIESSLFHDLSTLLTPQFHEPANIRHHVQAILADRLSNHVTFAISQATADDLSAYFGNDGRTFLVRPGVSWPKAYEALAASQSVQDPPPPYFLVLGTREPRKNLRLILQVLNRYPDLLDQAYVVIAGKAGWELETDDCPDAIRQAVQEGKIIIRGYIDEFRKYQLLRRAVAVIYPSMFEGFGLPILESLSVGTPCIASFSAAIPEVAGKYCQYFDPFSTEDLATAMREVLAKAGENARHSARARLQQAVSMYSWEAMLAQILEKLLPLMANPNTFRCQKKTSGFGCVA